MASNALQDDRRGGLQVGNAGDDVDGPLVSDPSRGRGRGQVVVDVGEEPFDVF